MRTQYPVRTYVRIQWFTRSDDVDARLFRCGGLRCSPRQRDVRVRRHEQHVRERHPHVELLGKVHVAEQRLLDGPLGSWPARDPPRSARRRAMRAVDHQTVRPLRPRAECALPLGP